ncbi:MAG: RidA family protein [Chloroflexi bacterium]|nr:RidA family protein [Chloroflexota bacterium]
MERELITTTEAPEIRGSYAIGAKCGPFLFLSGQVPVYPDGKVVLSFADLRDEEGRALASGRVPTDAREGPIAAQTWLIYSKIKKILEENGSSMDNIVHQMIYITDMSLFPTMERVRMKVFPQNPPPTTTVGVTALAIPGVLIEIQVNALVPDR